MPFIAVLARAEQTGWSLSRRNGQLFEPTKGYLVPVRRRQWWSVHERRLRQEIVKLYVYSRAQEFSADKSLLLHIIRSRGHYRLSTALLVHQLPVALRIVYLEDGDVVYDAARHLIVTQQDLDAAA